MLLLGASIFLRARTTQAFLLTPNQCGREHENALTKLMMAKNMKFSVKENLAGSISSDGVFQGRESKERPASSKLGVPSKQKKNKLGNNKDSKSSGAPLSKKERQRTGNGNVDSTLSTRIAAPEKEDVQVLEAKRGGKSVTIVR